MSPVHSPSAPGFGIRRRHASPITVGLFPECPEAIGPKRVVQSPAPAADHVTGGRNTADFTEDRKTVDRSSYLNRLAPDCPPPPTTQHGSQNRAGPIRIGAANSSERAHPRLVGIARLAASSPPAETRRKSAEKPEYFLLPVKSILNRCDSNRVPFEWTINPYRGCEFACKYCYARYTHEYMELDGSEFEKKIYVKKDAAPLLVHDISRKYSYASERSGGEKPDHIAIGTATDPYQPAEREHGVTRACLEELAKREGLSISVITKSNQIVRDIDLFKQIAARSELSLNITITTLRPKLARLLEPRAPRPDLRLAAVRQLREAGLAAGVSAAPLIPGITDREGDLEAVAEAAKEAGAQWFWSGVLFLMPSSGKQFFPFVREKFPRLAKLYEDWYRKNGYAPEEYRRKAAERVARIRQKYGFNPRPHHEVQRTPRRVQLKLGWDAAEVAQQVERRHACATG